MEFIQRSGDQHDPESKIKCNMEQSNFFNYVFDECQIEINIMTEIKEFFNKNEGKQPVIIFNLLALPDLSVSRNSLCNKSEDTDKPQIISFFNTLQSAGVEMWFYRTIERKSKFRDIPQNNIDEEIAKCIAGDTDLDEIIEKFGNDIPRVGKGNLVDIAKNYGREIFVKYFSDAPMEIASIALKMNAFAVIADNRHITFYEDEFQIWSCRNLNYDTMTTTKNDVQKIILPLASLCYPSYHVHRNSFTIIFDKIEEYLEDHNISRASFIEKYSEDNLDVMVRDMFSGEDSGGFLQLLQQYFNDMRNLKSSLSDSDIEFLTKHGINVYRIIHNEPMILKMHFYDSNRYQPKAYFI